MWWKNNIEFWSDTPSLYCSPGTKWSLSHLRFRIAARLDCKHSMSLPLHFLILFISDLHHLRLADCAIDASSTQIPEWSSYVEQRGSCSPESLPEQLAQLVRHVIVSKRYELNNYRISIVTFRQSASCEEDDGEDVNCFIRSRDLAGMYMKPFLAMPGTLYNAAVHWQSTSLKLVYFLPITGSKWRHLTPEATLLQSFKPYTLSQLPTCIYWTAEEQSYWSKTIGMMVLKVSWGLL